MRSTLRLAAASAFALTLIACGGGGGGSTSTAASAGADQTVTSGAAVNLAGTCSGPDCGNGYAWTQTSGTAVVLAGATTLTPSFTAPSVAVTTVLTFQLMVTGTCSGTCSDTVSITVNPTVVAAGADQPADVATSVSLSGTCSGAQCSNGVLWTQTGGTAVTINNAATLNASFTAPNVGTPETLTFQLAVGGTCAGTCSDTVAVMVGRVNITGSVQYARVGHNAATHALDYLATVNSPVRGATIEARAGSAANTCVAGTLRASAKTDASGNYSLAVPQITTLKVCVRSELVQADAGAGAASWDFQVVDNTASSAIYILESAAAASGTADSVRNLTAASGWGGAGYTSPRASAPFAILDDVYITLQKILGVAPTIDMAALDLNWSVNNTNSGNGSPTDLAMGLIGTSFYSNDEIYILGDDNNDTDEFDDHVIIHEFGHYLEDNLSRADSIGGSHTGGDLLDPRVAYGEGFGNAWSGIVTDNPVYQDSFGNLQSQGFDINVETDTVSVSGNQEGWYSETTVQGMLYDFYDANADTQTPAGGSTFTDNVSLGLQPLWNVWTGAQATTPAMTTIFPFLAQLRSDNAGAVAAINVIAAAREVNGTDAFGAGETNSGTFGNSSAAGCTTSNEALPVYISYTVGVTGTIGVPSAKNEGEYNALGNRRFLVFTVGAGSRSFAVTSATADADAYLYRGGVLVSFHEANGNEAWIESLAAGTYVLEVYSFQNVDGSAGTGGDACLQVTIN